MRRIAPLTVIEHFNVFKDCRLGLLVCLKVLQIDEFGLEGVEEALCHCVVPTVPLPAHTRLYPVPGEQRAFEGRGMVTAVEPGAI